MFKVIKKKNSGNKFITYIPVKIGNEKNVINMEADLRIRGESNNINIVKEKEEQKIWEKKESK